MDVKKFSVEDFVEYLGAKEFGDDVLDSFKSNGIDGESFLAMEEQHFKEVAPRIVDRIKLKKIQVELSKVSFL